MSTSPRPTPRLTLANNEVQAWSADLSDLRSCLAPLEQLLHDDERRRADRYRFPDDRALFVACRGLLRVLLAGYTGLEPHLVQIESGALGKPYLVEPTRLSPIRFNVSHSHGRVLLGFSLNCEMGVDVEQIRSIDDLDGLANRYFAPEERADLARLDLVARQRHFFAIWALKEAYLKGTGTGLTTALDSFYVCHSGDASQPNHYAVMSRTEQAVGPWSLIFLSHIPGFAAAIAGHGAGWRLCERSSQVLLSLIPGS